MLQSINPYENWSAWSSRIYTWPSQPAGLPFENDFTSNQESDPTPIPTYLNPHVPGLIRGSNPSCHPWKGLKFCLHAENQLCPSRSWAQTAIRVIPSRNLSPPDDAGAFLSPRMRPSTHCWASTALRDGQSSSSPEIAVGSPATKQFLGCPAIHSWFKMDSLCKCTRTTIYLVLFLDTLHFLFATYVHCTFSCYLFCWWANASLNLWSLTPCSNGIMLCIKVQTSLCIRQSWHIGG
jgi:hypothetical protein